jgi:hypothetical protein
MIERGVPDVFGSELHGVEIDDLRFDDNQA